MRSPGPDGADAFVHPVSGAVAGPYRPVHLYEPGGCCLGARPIDLHLAGLEALGAEFSWDRDRLVCRGKLRGGAVTSRSPVWGLRKT